MPPPNHRVWTVDDLNEGGGPGLAAVAADNSNRGSKGAPVHLTSCYHIPSLPRADLALSLLNRVVREFEPIARDRGYNILSVSEMCCCGDGLDHLPGNRKRRKQPDSVWGYNQWTTALGGRKTHTIHLRLRHCGARHHDKFLPYEDVAGTMAHELAHCEHGPHNDAFFKLMDEILEQHAVLMASGLSRDGGYTMPAFSGSGRLLGSSSRGSGGRPGLGGGVLETNDARQQHPSRPVPTSEQLRNARLRHLQKVASNAGIGGCKLGGDGVFAQWMSPAEAAVVAAEARRRMQQLRLRGDRCCRPVAIDGDGDGEETADDRKPPAAASPGNHPLNRGASNANSRPREHQNPKDASKRRRGGLGSSGRTAASLKAPRAGEENRKPPPPPPTSSRVEVIDLTGDEYNTGPVSLPGGARNARSDRATNNDRASRQIALWACRRCTFLNEDGASSSPGTYHNHQEVCVMCETPRFHDIVPEEKTTTKALRLRVYK